jgi:hypothetical protein
MAGRYLVYAEGETEVIYLKELVKAFQCEALFDIETVPQKAPIDLLAQLSKEVWWSQTYGKKPYEAGWAIFDQDHHKTYEKAISVAQSIPFVNIVWSNPCLESWFLMHFADVREVLPLDSKILLSEETKHIQVDEDVYEEVKVKRLRPVVDPETAVSVLKQVWPGYKKNMQTGYLSVLRPHMNKAMDKSHNNTNPKHPGSSFPEFIRLLASVGDSPEKAEQKENHCEAAAEPQQSLPEEKKPQPSPVDAMTTRLPEPVRAKYAALFANEPLENITKVREFFEGIQNFLMQFPLSTEQDADKAHYALMTAALAKQLAHTPVIILNCAGTGKAKEQFADILFRLMGPSTQLTAKYPSSESAALTLAKKNVEYLVLKASGKLTHFEWFNRMWQQQHSPFIVIVGNKLDTTAVRNFCIEVSFSSSRKELPYSAEELKKEITLIRSVLRQVSLLRNLTGNKVFKTNKSLTFWRGMVQSPLVWMKLPDCANHLNNT